MTGVRRQRPVAPGGAGRSAPPAHGGQGHPGQPAPLAGGAAGPAESGVATAPATAGGGAREAGSTPYPVWRTRAHPCRVLVVGDPVADLWVYGVPRRISREAPVLILEYDRQEIMPGGAAHCARSLAALGGQVVLAGPFGDDPWGRAVVDALGRAGVEVLAAPVPRGWQTPLKARFVAAPPAAPAQQVLRLDVLPQRAGAGFGLGAWLASAGRAAGSVPPQGAGTDPEDAAWAAFARSLREAVRAADAVVVADYGLSDLAPRLWPRLARWARGRPVVVDSRHRLLAFRGATLATPNVEELAEVWGRPLAADDLGRAAAVVRGRGRFGALVVTRGPEGMLVDPGDGVPIAIPAVRPAAVYDVTGAGDTVAAVLALALGSGLDVVGAARLANLAGSLAVRKAGTEPVTAAELEEAWKAWVGAADAGTLPAAGAGPLQDAPHGTPHPAPGGATG
ncbi:bifunctional heptose 7-phosphate kinase/heptose 1-phosphate adenyltransferase [Thermaerobacter composti]|uniref:PfkB family carbohydrate kinase n=1 Tax=Thermaerobacter composti TaxID=554949 RepID=A0ABZ0QQT3_9FIRM|nr:PfkB family carbohydrate kinase [Thermaerobacter composti]WPD18738.1 PfkB family carbohydrate kinase [Thermaerobacter composti]